MAGGPLEVQRQSQACINPGHNVRGDASCPGLQVLAVQGNALADYASRILWGAGFHRRQQDIDTPSRWQNRILGSAPTYSSPSNKRSIGLLIFRASRLATWV